MKFKILYLYMQNSREEYLQMIIRDVNRLPKVIDQHGAYFFDIDYSLKLKFQDFAVDLLISQAVFYWNKETVFIGNTAFRGNILSFTKKDQILFFQDKSYELSDNRFFLSLKDLSAIFKDKELYICATHIRKNNLIFFLKAKVDTEEMFLKVNLDKQNKIITCSLYPCEPESSFAEFPVGELLPTEKFPLEISLQNAKEYFYFNGTKHNFGQCKKSKGLFCFYLFRTEEEIIKKTYHTTTEC